MPTLKPNLDELPRRRRLPWLLLALILVVFALAIALVTQRTRATVRQQILDRDAEILRAMVAVGFVEVAVEIGTEVLEPVDQWNVLLRASRARGVVAARRYSTEGVCDVEAFPIYVPEGELADADLRRAMASESIARFLPDVPLTDIDVRAELDFETKSTLPLVEVLLPLEGTTGGEVLGVGQFMVEGGSVLREFAELDRSLAGQALLIFFGGGFIIAFSLGFAFQRLQLKHRQLTERTRDLLRANEELARSARTSAIGSVAAHLIHGLKNPLSGLHQFVREQTTSPAAGDNPAWDDAVATTRRMQEMVAEVVRVLREEEQGDAYELTPAELGAVVRQRLEPRLRQRGVSLSLASSGPGALDNRQSNLVALILTNLLENAVQASPPGGVVTLEMSGRKDWLRCRVSDEGPGLPEPIRRELFVPCRSTRDGGTGIGLAISKQLAGHLGAELQLESSSSAGTVFVLELPLRRMAANSPLDEPVLRS